MKKLLFFITALTLACSITGCGKSSNSKASSYDEKTQESSEEVPESYLYTELMPGGKIRYITETTAASENPKKTIDIFEELEVSATGTYPDLAIVVNGDDSEYSNFADELDFGFNLNVIDINNDKARIQISTDEGKLHKFLEDNNLELETDSKIYEYDAEDSDRRLLSEDMFTDEVKEDVVKGMIQAVKEQLEEENSSSEEFYSVMEEYQGNNPENQLEMSTYNTNLKNTELYIAIPPEKMNYEISEGNIMINALMNHSFMQNGKLFNMSDITGWDYSDISSVYAVIENDDGEKFVICACAVISSDGSLNEEKTTYKYMGSYDYIIQVHDSIEGCIEYYTNGAFSTKTIIEGQKIINVAPYTE